MIGSPYYWAFVAVITVAFAVVDIIALSRRELGRVQGAAIAIYLTAWVIILGLSLPIAPLGSLAWVFPAALRIAVVTMLIGGKVLGGAFRAEQTITHPELRPPKVPRRKLTETELHVAEQYDEQWQIEDRRRNHERELLAQGEREVRSRRRRFRKGDPLTRRQGTGD